MNLEQFADVCWLLGLKAQQPGHSQLFIHAAWPTLTRSSEPICPAYADAKVTTQPVLYLRAG